jgi:TonB family protein
LLVPVEFLERVAEPDWEAVMAHEFAHIARRDFLKNLAYGVAMLPLTWHPVAWLTRARVAESREMVCDAMAAEVVAGREGYARSLLRLASLLVKGTPDRTLHAIGIFDANLFERRVMKLTEKRMQGTGARRIVATVACVGLGVVTCGSALALRMEVGAPVAAVAVQDALAGHGPARVSGGVMAANVLTKVTPVYPPEAKEAKIEGAVVLKAVIGKDGLVNNLQVVSGPKELRRSALDSVRQWKYKPYLLNGEPMEVETTVTVTYSLVH